EFVPLAGVIVVPEEWEVYRPRVSLKLLDTPLGGQKTRLNLGTKPVELLKWSLAGCVAWDCQG
ncbi:MAG: hypothetical protein V3T78_08245, partial [Dehalococcoidia bacterium]